MPAQVSAAEKQRIIVSLGDSYSSGEGIEPFYGQDKATAAKVKDPDWLAHRSENSWSGMLTLPGVDGTMAKNRGTNWFFAASTGAETIHLHESQEIKYNYDGKSGTAVLDPQEKLLKEYSGKIDYVTFTIGGNDVGFAEIMTAAVRNSAEKLRTLLDGKLTGETFITIRNNIKQFYKDVASLAGPQAAIIVAGYPTLFNSEGFTVENAPLVGKVKVSAEKAEIINSYVGTFNDIIEDIVKECKAEGLNIWFAPVDFTGHEAYTDDPYINGIIFKAQAQDVNSKAGISSYSIHPNKSGAKVYAAAVQKVIDSIESGTVSESSGSGEVTLKADIDGSSIKLSWNKVSGASEYRLYQYKNNTWTKIKTTAKTSLNLVNLTNNRTYRFMVRAKVGSDLTAAAGSCQVKVDLCYKPVLTATEKSGKCTLKWTKVNNADKYGIYLYSGGTWKQVGTTKKLTCNVNVRSGKTYRLGIKAYVGGKWTEIGTASEVTVTAS